MLAIKELEAEGLWETVVEDSRGPRLRKGSRRNAVSLILTPTQIRDVLGASGEGRSEVRMPPAVPHVPSRCASRNVPEYATHQAARPRR